MSEGTGGVYFLGPPAWHPQEAPQRSLAALDNWPARTVPSRRDLLGRATSEGLPIMAYHFPFPNLGRVREDDGEGGGFSWEPAERASKRG